MKSVASFFPFLYWIIIYCIRQYWNWILYFRIRPFPALSIDSTNWTQQFVVSFFIHSSSINSHLINIISSLWRSALHPIVTRIVKNVSVNYLIDFRTLLKVSVTIDGDYNSIGTLEVMVVTWNGLCVFQFLYWIFIFVLNYYLLYSTILKLHFVFSYSTIPGT